MQFLQMAVADVAARSVPFPDNLGVLAFLIAFSGEVERGIPGPGISTRQANAALQQIHGRIKTHAAAAIDIAIATKSGAGGGISPRRFKQVQGASDLGLGRTRASVGVEILDRFPGDSCQPVSWNI